jgi:pimeloyl-ACP methyl ester carboxylesterase
MSRVTFISALIVLFALNAFGTGLALAQTPGANATPTAENLVLPPDAEIEGLGLGEWSGRSWQYSFSLPQETNPYFDETGEWCGYGQSGPVFMLAGADHDVTRACVVPAGAHVFVPIVGSECSTVEPEPFFGADEASLKQCARDNVDMAEDAFDMSAMQVSIDGQAVDDLSAYRAATPLFTLWLPPENLLDSPQRTADAAADGYQVMLAPLAEGEHTLTFTIPGPETVTIAYHLTVSSGRFAPAGAVTPIATPQGVVDWTTQVDGRTVHLACAGTGDKTLLVEVGGPRSDGGTADVASVGPDVSAALGARFCSYDRAGSGGSDPDPKGVRDIEDMARDLVAVLADPGLACPCMVAGVSMGGGIALTALGMDPSNFAGLVQLDSVYPGMIDEFIALAPDGSTEANFATDPYQTGDNAEHFDAITGFRQLSYPETVPNIPIVVASHGKGVPPPCSFGTCTESYPADAYEAKWQAGERALADALGAHFVVARNAGHSIADDDPAFVIGLVLQVFDAIDDPGAWATPAV